MRFVRVPLLQFLIVDGAMQLVGFLSLPFLVVRSTPRTQQYVVLDWRMVCVQVSFRICSYNTSGRRADIMRYLKYGCI